MSSVWHQLFNFEDYGALLSLVRNSVVAGAVLGVVAGVVSVFVMARDLPFAVHGISELSFAGAAGALLLGVNVVTGSLVGSLLAAVLIGLLRVRARDRNSIIGVLMPFGLGLGVLFLSLYKGRSAKKFGLLTGQIVAVDTPALKAMIVISAVVLATLLVLWRPLMFASVDPEVAAARGVPVRLLAPVFMLVLGMAVAMSVQVGRGTAGSQRDVHTGSRRDACHRLADASRRVERGVRHQLGRRRHPSLVGQQRADQSIRDHDRVRVLPCLPCDRRVPQPRTPSDNSDRDTPPVRRRFSEQGWLTAPHEGVLQVVDGCLVIAWLRGTVPRHGFQAWKAGSARRRHGAICTLVLSDWCGVGVSGHGQPRIRKVDDGHRADSSRVPGHRHRRSRRLG